MAESGCGKLAVKLLKQASNIDKCTSTQDNRPDGGEEGIILCRNGGCVFCRVPLERGRGHESRPIGIEKEELMCLRLRV
jgi:hypothetical protein